MNKKILVLFSIVLFLIFSLIIVLALKNKPQTIPTPPQTEVENQTVNVEVDKSKNFSIVLDSNPTTGYEWEAKFDEAFIKQISSVYMPNPAEEGQVGVGGTQNFEFSALQSGETEMTFNYIRPWEKENPVQIKKFKVKIL